MKLKKKNIIISICLIILSVIYTILVKYVDVAPIGTKASSVGFSTLNKFVFNFFAMLGCSYFIKNGRRRIILSYEVSYGRLAVSKLLKID